MSRLSSQELNTLSKGCNDMRTGNLEFLQIPQTGCPEHCPFTVKGHFRYLIVLKVHISNKLIIFTGLVPLFYNEICFFYVFKLKYEPLHILCSMHAMANR